MEITNYMKQITPEMTKTVNGLLERDFENATPEEIETYAQWVKLNALQDEEFRQRQELRKREIESNIMQSRKQADGAIDALNALAELAQRKLERISNEQA